jgi:hypothetical protein
LASEALPESEGAPAEMTAPAEKTSFTIRERAADHQIRLLLDELFQPLEHDRMVID